MQNYNQPVFSITETKLAPEKKLTNGKKTLMILGIITFLVTLSGISYFLGTKDGFEEKPIPTPTGILTKPLLETSSNTPAPTMAVATESAQTTGKSIPTPTPNIKTKVLTSEKGLDGFQTSDDRGSNSLEIRVGRNETTVTRGFVSFDISELPTGVKIQEVELKLYQTKVVGNPYTTGGTLKVDHLTYGNILDAADYSLAALVSNLTTFATINKSVGWKQTDVTEATKNDVANARSLSQFRIHFTTEVAGKDMAGDIAYFDSANDYYDHTNHPPQLVIRYH